ncbi:retention module-containing protein [Campylobacter concisus]|uniref:retention module-containing protein n=1 Tax=Campylobacter concisus TaxID=199 RepID=UPI00188360B1|nr:retention module-containing protein [Campylobacter concisus]MBE9863156.1 retention module-containing protein [Campylobacter concisus]
MSNKIGIIKSISQGANVIATAKDGTQRVLKVGDEIFLGETIQTTDIDSKVVITANDGKDIAIIGKDTLNLDKSVAHNESFGDDSVADVSAIQKALLDGANITDLEETAAGGNAAAGAGGDGVSLGAASFEEGGHYSNINENYRNLTDTNKAFQTPENSIGGYADANDAGAGDIGGSAANTPVAIKISLDGNGEAREATPNEHLVYNLGLSAATSSTTPTDLTLNLSGASAGRDYSNVMEYSLDGGDNWTTIQNGGTISGVAPSDIANVKVRVQVIDDYGQTSGNQNEGASSKDLGANIAPGINGYGVYKESVTLSVTTNNAAITSGEAEGKIIDNDDKIDITQDINPDDYEGVEPTIDRSFINYDPDNNGNNTMKTIIDTKDGDDTITIKEGVNFRSGLSDFKDDGNDVIKMGDGDDVFNIEKDADVSSTKIDMGNAGGENNQDTVIIDGGIVLNTMITSHDGNDKFTVRGDATLGDVLFKTGKGEDTVNIESGITVTSLKSVKIDTGADNDVVNIKHDLIDDWSNHGSTDGSEYEGVRTASFIKTGEGNDTISVTARLNGVDIDSGDSDTGDMLNFISAGIYNSEIKSGNGNDKIVLQDTKADVVDIYTGEGNDSLTIKGSTEIKNNSATHNDPISSTAHVANPVANQAGIHSNYIEMGKGRDTLTIERGAEISNTKINTSSADAGVSDDRDSVDVTGAKFNNAAIETGYGEDVITLTDVTMISNDGYSTYIGAGGGNDTINIYGNSSFDKAIIYTNGGDDHVNVDGDVSMVDSNIMLENGNVTLNVAKATGLVDTNIEGAGVGNAGVKIVTIDNAELRRVTINTADDGDRVTIGAGTHDNTDVKIFTQGGDDTININSDLTGTSSVNLSPAAGEMAHNDDASNINSGKGNDTINIADNVTLTNTYLSGGDGNDLVDLGKDVSLNGTAINGGDGIDTLKIHDGSFNTTNAGKISGFEVLDMSEANEHFTFQHASDIANFIKNVGGEGATSLIVKGDKFVGSFTEGSAEVANASTEISNGYVYSVSEGGQTFTLTIQNVNVNELLP